MPLWADLLVSIIAALLVTWLALIVALWRSGRGLRGLAEASQLLPDLLKLIYRLARDRSLPGGVRLRLWVMLGYLASPLDLIPDFVPIVGYADDAIIIALALRSVVRSAGPEPLARHWPGTPAGLTIVRRLAGLKASPGAAQSQGP